MSHIVIGHNTLVPIEGYVYRFFYWVPTAELKQWVKPYYLSKTGRICSKVGFLFNGMRKECLGQFINSEDVYYEMFSTKENYHKNKAKFLSLVIKRLNKLNRIKKGKTND